jgi:hypothetical protein
VVAVADGQNGRGVNHLASMTQGKSEGRGRARGPGQVRSHKSQGPRLRPWQEDAKAEKCPAHGLPGETMRTVRLGDPKAPAETLNFLKPANWQGSCCES